MPHTFLKDLRDSLQILLEDSNWDYIFIYHFSDGKGGSHARVAPFTIGDKNEEFHDVFLTLDYKSLLHFLTVKLGDKIHKDDNTKAYDPRGYWKLSREELNGVIESWEKSVYHI